MESANTTEMVQEVSSLPSTPPTFSSPSPSPSSSLTSSSASAASENADVRVHSRLRTRPAKPQGLYPQVLNKQVSNQPVSNQKKSNHKQLSEPELNKTEIDQQVLAVQDSMAQEGDQAGADSQAVVSKSSKSSAREAESYESETCEPESFEIDSFETVSCVTFDASPVEQSQEDESQSNKGVSANSGVTGHSGIIDVGDSVSKKDLVALLEGFVKIIKTDEPSAATAITTTTGTGLELSRGGALTNEARVDDRTVEIDQLRGLVMEAQDTIIKLLTDRVDDRSRIATLEAQLNLLPDLQAQADRAMSVAVRTEEYRTELTKMKFELDRFRLFRVRVEAEQKKGSVFNRIQKWLFSRPNAKDETLQRNSYQKMVDGSFVKPNISSVAPTNVQPKS
jgi:hypothetical protein